MKIVAAGVSGFLGTRLTAALTDAGHQVTRLVRSDPTGPTRACGTRTPAIWTAPCSTAPTR